MPQQQNRSIRPAILLTGLLLAGVSLARPAQGQSAQGGLASSMMTANFPPAETNSYVFLDPLEGNHHAARSEDSQHQGIQMHGHWIIDVMNPDGTTAQHRDFENTLLVQGNSYLARLMAGFWVPSDYAIGVGIGGSQPPCMPVLSNASGCVLVHSMTTNPAFTLCFSYSCSTGLTYTAANFFTGGAPSLTLAGSFTATQAGSLSSVATYAGLCPYNTTYRSRHLALQPAVPRLEAITALLPL